MSPLALPRTEHAVAILADSARRLSGAFATAAAAGVFPPLPLLNQFLGHGHDPDDAERTGGTWSPFELSADECAQVLDAWRVAHPDAVVDGQGASHWQAWTASLHRRLAGLDEIGVTERCIAPEVVAALALAAGPAPQPAPAAVEVEAHAPLASRFTHCPYCAAPTVAAWRKLLPAGSGACSACHRNWRFAWPALPLALVAAAVLLLTVFASHPSLAAVRLVSAVSLPMLAVALLLLPVRRHV